ncbi:hypothetical protein V1477_020849 [Vespula maculifrons]|uniref:Uncharacterized protein n=1 Tax=Vespula maculifrons TaxID=7453 RepID=A0ABD2AN39_VESMC
MTSDYYKLTNGVKTITIIIYKERLRIYDRLYIREQEAAERALRKIAIVSTIETKESDRLGILLAKSSQIESAIINILYQEEGLNEVWSLGELAAWDSFLLLGENVLTTKCN